MRARDFAQKKLKESLQKGDYHLWTVHFEDGSSTKIRVHWDETSDADLQRHFKDRKIVKVDRDYSVHSEYDTQPTRHYWTGDLIPEEKRRLDPKCWKGYRKQGTKMKGGIRVNNCVKVKK